VNGWLRLRNIYLTVAVYTAEREKGMIKAFVTFALACASINAQVAIPPSGTSAEPANSVVHCDQKALSTVPTLDAKAGNIWLTSSFARYWVVHSVPQD
jgi:hypothetical protein